MNIERMNKGSWGKVRAFFDLKTDEGFILKGFKLVEGINGLFVGFPSEKKDGDDEYRDTIWAERELKESVTNVAKAYYNNGNSNTTPKQSESIINDEDIPF